MSKSLTVAGLLSLALALALAACGQSKPGAPTLPSPQVETAGVDPARAAPSSSDASVPSAQSVFATPPKAASTSGSGTRSNSALTRTEEASTMPQAGQANDHSSPLAPAASAGATRAP